MNVLLLVLVLADQIDKRVLSHWQDLDINTLGNQPIAELVRTELVKINVFVNVADDNVRRHLGALLYPFGEA